MTDSYANAFELLSLHEETDASAVAKLQSKRAQKRLRRQAQLRDVPATAPASAPGHHLLTLQPQYPADFLHHHEPPIHDTRTLQGDHVAMSDALFNQWLMAQTGMPTSPPGGPARPTSPSPRPLSPAPFYPSSPTTPSWASKARESEHLPDPSTPTLSNRPSLRPAKTKHPPPYQSPSPTPAPPQEAFPPLPIPAPGAPAPHSHASLRLPLRAPNGRKPHTPRHDTNVKVLRAGKERAYIADYGADLQRVTGLDLEWDLRLEGMVPKAVTLPDHMSNLDADAEAKEQVWAQLARQGSFEEDSGAGRNCEFDTMWQMWAKAANKHRQTTAGGWSSEDAGSTSGDSYGPGGDEANPYWCKTSTKEWRQQVEAMVARGWEPQVQGRAKHIKWRRELVDGSVQSLTMPCTPSDSICGIRNFQADLARRDREAQEVLERVLRAAG